MRAERFIIVFVFIGIGAFFFPEDRAIVAIIISGIMIAYFFEDDIGLLKGKIRDLESRLDSLESSRYPD